MRENIETGYRQTLHRKLSFFERLRGGWCCCRLYCYFISTDAPWHLLHKEVYATVDVATESWRPNRQQGTLPATSKDPSGVLPLLTPAQKGRNYIYSLPSQQLVEFRVFTFLLDHDATHNGTMHIGRHNADCPWAHRSTEKVGKKSEE